MPTTFDDLPSEVVQQILYYVPAETIPTLQQVCRRVNELVDSLLWRHLCRREFRYWDARHGIKEKFNRPADRTNWKELYMERYLLGKRTTAILNSILATQAGRIDKFEQIVESGYDVKDTLLRHLKVEDDAEDVLARRYYSTEVLGCLQRKMAIQEWLRLNDDAEPSLERALAAFDMFVLHDRDGDYEETSMRLDDIAEAVRASQPGFDSFSTRRKAIMAAAWLRERNFLGIEEDDQYHNLQNNFIGIALRHPDHPSLPLISTAIYCCVLKRLGLDAHACGFPFHVVAIVRSPPGLDLDGNATPSEMGLESMYMDPFASDKEMLVEDLISRLRTLGGAYSSNYRPSLGAASVPSIVLRTGGNIINSVRASPQIAVRRTWTGPDHASIPDEDTAFYGALWAFLMLVDTSSHGEGHPADIVTRRRYLPHIISRFESQFPTDAFLVEKYIVPLFQDLGEYAQLRESIRVMRNVDTMPKVPKRRTRDISRQVRYQVGQVFRHRRYRYEAVITGWDSECSAGEEWMAQMRVDSLSRGRHQSFYHVLTDDKSIRYVAEDNIELISPGIPHNLMHLAGRHFKRWDPSAQRFVSNIRDEYPDN